MRKTVDINNIITNPYISDDLNVLRKHYSLLLEYVIELEHKIEDQKRKDEYQQRIINGYEMKEKGYDYEEKND